MGRKKGSKGKITDILKKKKNTVETPVEETVELNEEALEELSNGRGEDDELTEPLADEGE